VAVLLLLRAQALDVNHAVNTLDGADDALQVFQVHDVNGHVNAPAAVAEYAGAGVADVGLDVGNRVGQHRQHALTVFGADRERDGVGRRRAAVGADPVHVHDALAIDHQVGGVAAALCVDGDAFAQRDVTDHVFAADRVAAARAVNHHVVNPLHRDAVFAEPQGLAHDVADLLEPRGFALLDFGQFLFGDEAHQN